MSLAPKIQQTLNEQLRSELTSVSMFLGMLSYFQKKKFYGHAEWMRLQAKEEMEHAWRVIQYIMDRDGVPEMPAIEKCKHEYSSPEDVFNVCYDYQKNVTAMVNNWMKIAEEEKDYSYQCFLDFFVEDQVEEEKKVRQIVRQYELLKESTDKEFFMEKLLSKRLKKEKKKQKKEKKKQALLQK